MPTGAGLLSSRKVSEKPLLIHRDRVAIFVLWRVNQCQRRFNIQVQRTVTFTLTLKREFIDLQQAEIPIIVVCRRLLGSLSGYYAWRGRLGLSTFQTHRRND